MRTIPRAHLSRLERQRRRLCDFFGSSYSWPLTQFTDGSQGSDGSWRKPENESTRSDGASGTLVLLNQYLA